MDMNGRPMPGMVLMAPSDEAELNRSLRLALALETPSAVRYPRDNVPAVPFEDEISVELRSAAKLEWTVGRSRVLRDGADATLIVYGALAQNVMIAARARGLDTCPQAAFTQFHSIIAQQLALPDNEMVVCGMALGVADPSRIENSLVTEREPVAGVATFLGEFADR